MKHRRESFRKERGRRITRLLARDGTTCRLCDRPLDRHIQDVDSPEFITLDHIVPRSAGGLSLDANLQLAHKRCNEARGSDPLDGAP